jgi:hypothetical protein
MHQSSGGYWSVSVKLKKMRIVNVRVGFKRFYGAVHADIGLWHGAGRKINFKQLIAPPDLQDVSRGAAGSGGHR